MKEFKYFKLIYLSNSLNKMKKNIKQFEDSIYKQKSSNNGKIGILANNIFLELTFEIFIHRK